MSIETNIEVTLTNRDRTSSFFRLIFAIPMLIWVATLSPSSMSINLAGFFTISVLLSLLVLGIYPSYLLTFNHALLELHTRVASYVLLLTDKYPTIERNDDVAVIFPDVKGGATLNRWMPLVKWILAIPTYIVGTVYVIASWFCVLVGWVSILFTGSMPEWAARFIYATICYVNDILGYAFILVTDKYPGFALDL